MSGATSPGVVRQSECEGDGSLELGLRSGMMVEDNSVDAFLRNEKIAIGVDFRLACEPCKLRVNAS
jgi:hypothetical protein